jgi:hypothetical protein
VTDATSTDAWVTFAQGVGKLVWSTSTLTQPRVIDLAGPSASNVADLASKAGRAVCFHKDRMFVGGSGANPSRLYFSGIGTPTTFTTANDYLDIGGDDGEAIQDLVSVEGLLMVAKTNRVYLISGSGVESFFVNELAGGSAAPGRPAVRTPYGTILAGSDDIWVIQGGGVDPMSRPLGAGYQITGYATCAYGQDSVLINDSASGTTYRVNLVTGAWAEERVLGGETPYGVFSLNGRHYYGTNNSYNEVGGTRRLSTARTYDALTGGMVQTASTGRLALFGPSVEYTPKYLYFQARNHDTDHPNELRITVTTNVGEMVFTKTITDEVQRERIPLGPHKGVEWVQVTFDSASSAIAGAVDVERVMIGVDIEEKH